MSSMVDMSSEQLVALEKTLKSRYDTLKSQNLALDMTRGKPTPEQLDLSDGLLTLPGAGQFTSPDGTDCRNYGGLDGLPGMKTFFGEILGAPVDQVIIGGNASLNLMYDALLRA